MICRVGQKRPINLAKYLCRFDNPQIVKMNAGEAIE
jgi:hypothetical protein